MATNRSKGKVSSLIGVIGFLIALIGYNMFFVFPSMTITPFQKEQTYIIQSEDADNYILDMHNDGTMTLYHYIFQNDQNGNTIACGYKTDYSYYGYYFNKMFWNLHYMPAERLALWNRFAFFDNSESRAQVWMTVLSNKKLNMSEDSNLHGTFKVNVVEKEDHLDLGDQHFSLPNGLDSLVIETIRNDFEMNAVDCN